MKLWRLAQEPSLDANRVGCEELSNILPVLAPLKDLVVPSLLWKIASESLQEGYETSEGENRWKSLWLYSNELRKC
jgi:hypothetical protein